MNRRARSRALAAVIAAAATFGSFAAPAGAQPALTPRPATPPAAPSADPGDDHEPRAPLTPAEVKRQLAEATRLEASLAAQDAQLAAASTRLAALATRSNAAMAALTQARAAEATALAHEQAQLARLKVLAAETAKARRDLANMAYDAYVHGSDALREMAALVDLVTDASQASTVDYLARERAADEKKYAALVAEQRRTAQAAAKARAERQAATAAAQKAQADAAAALASQQAALVDLQRVASATRARLAAMGVDTTGVGRGIDLASLRTIVTTPLCTLTTGDFPNGMIPGSALCPIAGRPGHMMRPEAARALNALQDAYAKSMGTRLCLTDTYRTYAAQVDVRRRKPSLAAVPGTSNHGLGLAVDLCGGIESFGTPQHRWMQQHAPLFGFYHPAWAQAGGSKPEPWHWEFAS